MWGFDLRKSNGDGDGPIQAVDPSTPGKIHFYAIDPGTYTLSGSVHEEVPVGYRGAFSPTSMIEWRLREPVQIIVKDEPTTVTVELELVPKKR